MQNLLMVGWDICMVCGHQLHNQLTSHTSAVSPERSSAGMTSVNPCLMASSSSFMEPTITNVAYNLTPIGMEVTLQISLVSLFTSHILELCQALREFSSHQRLNQQVLVPTPKRWAPEERTQVIYPCIQTHCHIGICGATG